jgi:hypothetical protein
MFCVIKIVKYGTVFVRIVEKLNLLRSVIEVVGALHETSFRRVFRLD